jgi:hypothetical protein
MYPGYTGNGVSIISKPTWDAGEWWQKSKSFFGLNGRFLVSYWHFKEGRLPLTMRFSCSI